MGTIEAPGSTGLSLPAWPAAPVPVDETGRRYLLVGFGDEGVAVTDAWSAVAAAHGPVATLVASRFDKQAVDEALATTRCGVRVMVAGPLDAVLLTLAAARENGAEPEELRSFVTSTDVLPLYCAHCRATNSVAAAPGDVAPCPTCGVALDVHPHLSAARGSYLGSDASAREIA